MVRCKLCRLAEQDPTLNDRLVEYVKRYGYRGASKALKKEGVEVSHMAIYRHVTEHLRLRISGGSIRNYYEQLDFQSTQNQQDVSEAVRRAKALESAVLMLLDVFRDFREAQSEDYDIEEGDVYIGEYATYRHKDIVVETLGQLKKVLRDFRDWDADFDAVTCDLRFMRKSKEREYEVIRVHLSWKLRRKLLTSLLRLFFSST